MRGRIQKPDFPANKRLRCASSTQAKSRFFMERHGKTIAQVEFEEWWIEWIVCISLVNIKDHDSLGGAVQKLFCKTPYSWLLKLKNGFPKHRATAATLISGSLERLRSLRRYRADFQSQEAMKRNEAKWILYLCIFASNFRAGRFCLTHMFFSFCFLKVSPNICKTSAKTKSRTVD